MKQVRIVDIEELEFSSCQRQVALRMGLLNGGFLPITTNADLFADVVGRHGFSLPLVVHWPLF